ncbi:vWA domain-containing protein [Jannaschia aquimarina]|uniref:von Willebrand factor type A domain protein n=1 Tax=Jannaschia aquimarina TaxID=935700 RepID=A0A0D1CME8_9RHOB|nr:VWA domain-containing protein [Jannaschia aquimarina]KIT15947.1 von Willebrand factor type A domain protein [Jannaschia aquimarina]SNS98443.1 von Willebrand factor type A domain-containing protein [Jannaschia aquimarina]
MKHVRTTLCAAAIFSAPCGPALAQSPDIVFVFDGSGSMWGQINGRTKIEIARETLSSVLSEVSSDMQIGMIAYGHRQKGVCADIETVVPIGPANLSVPRIVDAANRLQPKGKTPLTDAVRMAADELRYTENAATVVLVTDGIETCDADPCALGRELEAAGIDFTAHVVGFGLSEEDGTQVQCLADNTGGLYLSASNGDELGNALRRTVSTPAIASSEDDFGPEAATTRDVRFVFRDTDGGEQLGTRQLSGTVERADGTALEPDAFQFAYPEANGNSATGSLEPGRYIATLRREGGSAGGYTARYEFDIPEGAGEHVVEASLSAELKINPFLNPGLPYDPESPPKGSVKTTGWAYFSVYPVIDGAISDEAIVSEAYSDLQFPLAAGTYLVRGNIDRTTTAEQLIEVNGPTAMDFSFDVTRVFIDAREANGQPVVSQTTYWYEEVPSGRNYWRGGYGATEDGPTPFYLPTGTWITNVGGEGYGGRRSELVVDIPGDFQDIRIEVGEGEALSEADKAIFTSPDYVGCIEIAAVKYGGCLVKKAVLAPIAASQTAQPQSTASATAPSGDTDLRFVDPDTQRDYVRIDFPEGAAPGQARIVMGAGWCGDETRCAGSIAGISADIVAALRSGRTETFVDSWDVGTATVNPDGIRDAIEVSEGGMTRRFVLEGAASALSGTQADTNAGDPLDGLSGTAYAFAYSGTDPKIHVVFGPSTTQDATIVLTDGWCGDGTSCPGRRITVAYDAVDHLIGGEFAAGSISVDGYRFDISSFGEAEKDLHVSGSGTEPMAFTFVGPIDLGGS